MINKYGADALRLYLVNSPVVRAETLRFKEEGVFGVVKDVFLPWYNAYRWGRREGAGCQGLGVRVWGCEMAEVGQGCPSALIQRVRVRGGGKGQARLWVFQAWLVYNYRLWWHGRGLVPVHRFAVLTGGFRQSLVTNP